MSEDVGMWTYWRGKYGYETALRDYYPILSKQHPVLSIAIVQMKMAQLAIEKVFEELQE